jgi:Family of unknown function (DUF5343)
LEGLPNTTTAKAVLAGAIRSGYAGLFQLYPDAQNKDDEAVRNWLKGEVPSASEDLVRRAVTTFRTLVAEADFKADAPAVTPAATTTTATTPITPAPATIVTTSTAVPGGPTININIQLELPPSDKPEVYDALFESMKKHLFPDA